jgi:hypothetical protein
MYERSENSDELTYLRRLILPSLMHEDFSMKKSSNEIIKSLTLSANEENLLVGTNCNHLYQISFSNMVGFDLFNLILFIYLGLYKKRNEFICQCT